LVYVIPVFIVALTLFITQLQTKNELIIGLAALLSLIPYFLLFKFFNKRIQRIFSFRIDKLSENVHANSN
jgi:positive regulator of sigma E activity